MFKNLHVVEADTKMNNITGESLGEGNIKVRVSSTMKPELDKVIKGLKDKGCEIEKQKECKVGRKR